MELSFERLCRDYSDCLVRCRLLDRRSAFEQNRLRQLRQSDSSYDRRCAVAAKRRLEVLEHQLEQLHRRQQQIAGQIRQRCEALNDPLLAELMQYRYIDSLQWAQIGELLGYEVRQLNRLHRAALERLAQQEG